MGRVCMVAVGIISCSLLSMNQKVNPWPLPVLADREKGIYV